MADSAGPGVALSPDDAFPGEPYRISRDYCVALVETLVSDDGWTMVRTGHDEVSLILYQEFPAYSTSLKAFKVWTTVEAPVSELERLLHTEMIARHGEWNETFMRGRMVERFSDDENVQYWRYQVDGPITDRSFVVARRRVVLDDDSIALIDVSVDHDKCPDEDDAIRADLPFNVRFFRPLDSHRTEFFYMNLTDIKGSIPKFLMNKENPNTSLEEIMHIKELVERSYFGEMRLVKARSNSFRVIAEQKETLTGELRKRPEKGISRSWQKRHFKLMRDGRLGYWKSDNPKQPARGYITLRGAYVISPSSTNSDSKSMFTFDIQTVGRDRMTRSYQLAAATEESRAAWVAGLEEVISALDSADVNGAIVLHTPNGSASDDDAPETFGDVLAATTPEAVAEASVATSASSVEAGTP